MIALLFAITFAAYAPAIRAGFIWDDDAHVTKPELRSAQGLHDIWFTVGATQQYYPLLHSAFWMQFQLWGESAMGYHIVNIALHALAATLVLLILRRLEIPGALLAACVFALHPVMVESVAWVTEQKNTLSAVFYLAALLAYLRFDRTRSFTFYAIATLLFICALLSKTVTASLPAAILVIVWWKRGKVSFMKDLLPLLPWLVLGAISGMMTAYLERKQIGAEGADFDLHFLQRGVLAGRVIAFYLTKLLWPSNLTFIYPHWTISISDPLNWIVLALVIGTIAGLWMLRHRVRGPLAALLFFVGTLVPVLGFFNVYPFLFSYVADHFQYLASLGIITLIAAMIAIGIARLSDSLRWTGYVASIALLATLGTLTHRQSRIYHDAVTLYNATLERNPACWMAHNNLAFLANNTGDSPTAITHARAALAIRQAYPEAHCNLGIALFRTNDIPGAITELEEAVRLAPNYAQGHNNLALALARSGRFPEAIEHFRYAGRLRPWDLSICKNLAIAYAANNEPRGAVFVLERGIRAAQQMGDTAAVEALSGLLQEVQATAPPPPQQQASPFDLGPVP